MTELWNALKDARVSLPEPIWCVTRTLPDLYWLLQDMPLKQRLTQGDSSYCSLDSWNRFMCYSNFIPIRFNSVTLLAKGLYGLMQISGWCTCSIGSGSDGWSHRRAEREESGLSWELGLDSDEKSICYSATINYTGKNGQATKGFQK